MTGVAAGGGLNFDIHTDVVEAALDAEDFTPLVRVVFDAVASSLSTATTKQALLARAPQATPAMDAILEDEALNENGAASGRRASDRLKAMRKEAAAPVISALEKVVESRSAELSQICRGNAEEIVSSLQELGAMQQGARELRERISEGDIALRDAGTQFLDGLEQLQNLRRLQSSVAASGQAVGAVRQLLSLCAQAGRAVNANELYKAFKLLERAENEFLNSATDTQWSGGAESASEAPIQIVSDERLRSFLSSRVAEMQTAIQSRAVKDFNSWLVIAREEGRGIGLLVLRKAAWECQREQNLVMQRRRLASVLLKITDPEAAASAFAKPLPVWSAGSVRLSAAMHPAAAGLLEGWRPEPFTDVLGTVDMSLLHRCLQIHTCLGKLTAFQEYYQINRRMQLNNDLAAQGNFLQQYQSYLAQVVGFFVIEDRVGRAAEELSGAQVDSGWETAVTYLKLALETAFATLDSASSMLAIKDMMLLACRSLDQCGYHVASLLDVLSNAQRRYHDILSAGARPEVERIVRECRSAPVLVNTYAEATELSESLGLTLSVGGSRTNTPPPTPFRTPFSQMVPELLRISHRYVENSTAYAWGLVGNTEVLSIVRLNRDNMLLELSVPALDEAIQVAQPTDPGAVDSVLQNLADLHALTDSLQCLDDWTFQAVRGAPPREQVNKSMGSSSSDVSVLARASKSSTGTPTAGEDAVNLAKSPSQARQYTAALTKQLAKLQQKAEAELQGVLAAKLKGVLGKASPPNWLPDAPVATASAHTPAVSELNSFLQETLDKVARKLSQQHQHMIGEMLMRLLGSTLLDQLFDEEVQGYNLYSLFRLNDDALALAEFANNNGNPGLQTGLEEVIQFCDLMVTGRLEEILDPAKRSQDYAAVDLKRLLVLLRKYREVTPKREHAHGLTLRPANQPASFLKKKTAERVAKQVRAQLEAAGAQNLPK